MFLNPPSPTNYKLCFRGNLYCTCALRNPSVKSVFIRDVIELGTLLGTEWRSSFQAIIRVANTVPFAFTQTVLTAMTWTKDRTGKCNSAYISTGLDTTISWNPPQPPPPPPPPPPQKKSFIRPTWCQQDPLCKTSCLMGHTLLAHGRCGSISKDMILKFILQIDIMNNSSVIALIWHRTHWWKQGCILIYHWYILSVNNEFQTWFVIGCQQSLQPIRSHLRNASLSTRISAGCILGNTDPGAHFAFID